jgi:peptide deformylase
MALLPILKYPDPRLKLVAKQVEAFDAALATTCADLFETMYAFDGVGLAATQVNIQQRIFVLDISENQTDPLCIINPKIIATQGLVNREEGCLSFPGVFAKVQRHAQITVEYATVTGDKQTLEATDLLAICIQHELDHLDGITFFDHISPLKRKLLRAKLDKYRDKVS